LASNTGRLSVLLASYVDFDCVGEVAEVTYQEMIEAAKEIKRFCQRNKNCDCPFADDAGICRLQADQPDGWRVSTWIDWEVRK
jgi:hypothetical protein